MNSPKVSIVLGSYNRLPFLKLTIESIKKEVTKIPHEIIIVDGGSTDGTIPYLSQQEDIITIIQHNREEVNGKLVAKKSWGHFMNLGFRRAKGKFICMVSDDCLIVPEAIKRGINLFEKETSSGKKIGAMAFYWRNWPEEDKYKILTTLGDNIYVNHGMYSKEALEKVGYIDEDSFDFYCADSDLCLKMKQAGYETVISPDSYIEHYSHANRKVRSANAEKFTKDTANFKAKWENIFGDPDPNKTIEKEFTDVSKTAKKFKTISSVNIYNNLHAKIGRLIYTVKRTLLRLPHVTPKKVIEKSLRKIDLYRSSQVNKGQIDKYKIESDRLVSNYKTHAPLKLHFGCGPRVLKDWINIDLFFTPYETYLASYTNKYYSPDMRGDKDDFYTLDITKAGLPLPDGSVDVVFHEDFLEHLNQRNQVIFLAETYRVLKSGGVHRVNTPNLAKSMEASDFPKGKNGVYEEWDRSGHLNVLTKSSLEEMARMVGYSRVEFNQRNKSLSPLVPVEYRPGSDRPEDGNIFADLIK